MAGFNFQNTGKNPIIPVAPKSAAPTASPSAQNSGSVLERLKAADPSKQGAPYKQKNVPTAIVNPAIPRGYDFSTPATSSKFSKVDWSFLSQRASSPVLSANAKSGISVVQPIPGKSNTNPLASVALSLAGNAVDTVGKAADFILGGYIRSVGDVKAGVDFALKTVGIGNNVDPYLKLASSGIYSDKSAQDKAAKIYDASMLRNFDSLTGQYKGLENIPVLTDEKKWLKNLTSGISNSLNESADVANQPKPARFAANVLGSIPYTLVSRIPYGVGAFLNYGTSTMQGIEQKLAESGKDVNNLTSIEKLDIMNYATGSALVNAGSEQIFPAGKGALNLGKALAKGAIKDVVKEGAKYLAKQGIQEGAEEGISYIGQGIVAMFTTNHVTNYFATKNSDPSKTLLGIASGSALINLVDFSTTVGTAAASGVLFSAFGLGSSYVKNKSSNIYSNFKNTKAAYEETKNIPVDQMTDDQVKNNFDAIAKDVSDPKNAAVIMAQSKVALETMEQNMPVSKQIEMAQNVLQEVYTDDTSRMSDTQLADYTEKADGLKEKISDLQSQKTVMTSNGTKYTVSQAQQFVAKYEDQVSFYKDSIASVDSPAIKASLQDDLDYSNQQLSKYKSMLAQATPKTSTEMLADLQASRMPSSAAAAQDVKLGAVDSGTPVPSSSKSTNASSATKVVEENKYSKSQMELIIQNREMEIRRARDDLRSGINMDGFKLTPDEKLELERTISNGTKTVNKYKGVLEQSNRSSDGDTSKAIADAPSGDEIESVKSPGKHVFSTAKAVQIQDVIASTDAYGNENPKFKKQYQPRDVKRRTSTAQIAAIAGKSDFLMYRGLETVQQGTPMISSDGYGIVGNHRLAALMLMFKDNIKKFREYQQYMIKNAAKFGLDPKEMTGDFIVVRVLSPDEDLDSLVNEGNVSGVATMSTSEIAVNDSKNITDSVMAKFVTDENGEMTGEESRLFNTRFINEVIPESEQASMYDKDGQFSMGGIQRIRNAMFYRAYGNLDFLTLVSESTENIIKKMTNALVGAGPRIITLKEGIAAGKYYDVPTAQFITDTAQKWAKMKQSKDGKNMLNFLTGKDKQKQESMFNEKENPLEKSLLLAFEANRGSSKKLSALLNDIIDLHMAQGTPASSFFGDINKTVNLNTIVDVALEGGNYGNIQTIENLYAESGDGTDESAATVGPIGNRPKAETIPGAAAQENTRKAESVKNAERVVTAPKAAFDKQAEDMSKQYKSAVEVEQAIYAIQAESLQLDSLPAAEKEKAIIKMNMQLFAMKKALSNFADTPSGSRLHGFIDSFSKMLQVGSTKDMKRFIMDSVPIEELTYRQLANKDEIAESDAKIARGGKDYQEGLLESFMSSPGTMLAPNETVSMSRYAVELTKSSDAATVARGMDALYALKDRLTQAGQFTQSVKAALDTLIPERHAKAVANDLDNKSSDPIQKEDLKKAVKQTKKVVDDAVRKSLDDTVGEFEQGVDKSDSSAVDQSSPKGKKASMEQILSALIKKDITGKERKISTADNLALQVLHNIYLELNPSEKGKATNIFDTLSKMATNKEKYGDVWDKAKPLVEAAIAKENGKREAAGLDELVVPENYLDRFRDPVFTKRMMDQAVRQVLNYNRTDMKSEARKFYLEGGTGENTINRFVSGLRDKFDDAYGQAMPDETFDYLKDHLVKQFKKSLESSRDLISRQIRSQVEKSADKNVLNRKSRIDKTIDQLTDSVISGALDDDNLSKIWAAKLGLNYISDEMRTTISERIIEIDKIENEDERFQAYSDFVSQLGSQIRATNIQKFNAWRRFAMLCNPKTWTRNGASNYAYLPYVRVMDGLTYHIQKTMGLDQQYMARGKKHLVAGSNKQIDVIVDSYLTPAKIRTIMEENGKYSLGEHLKREVKIFESKPLEFITKAPLNIISTGTLTKDGKHGIAFFGDQGILKTHLTDAFRNRLNALGYNESLPESDKKAKISSAMDYAKGEALTRTYRSASVISERLTGLKTNVNSDAQIRSLVKSGTEKDMAKAKKRRRELNAVNSAIDLAVPFIVTPSAIATEGYRLSPVALGISVGELIGMKIKGTTKTDPYRTAQVSKQISQALVGVGGQWVLGAALALTGAITGAPPDTDKERKEWALEGKTAYSLYVPGIGWMSYSWCQPVALGIMGGADIATVIKNGGYNVNAIGGAITAGINGVVGATLYGNIVDNLFGGVDVATNIKNFLVSGATQTLPTVSKALAQTIDPYARDTYSGTTAQALLYRVLSYIPFASMLQPVKIDIWGNPVKNADMGIGFAGRSILNFIAPFTLPKAQTDVVSQEVIRLFNATGSNSTLPIAVQSGFTIEKGEFAGKYSLSGQDYIDYQALAGQYSFEIAKITIADKRYTDASDADKVKILTKVYSKAVDRARLEFVSTHKTARVK